MYLPNSRWTWAFVIVTTIEAFLGIGLECYVFAHYQLSLKAGGFDIASSKTISTFLVLYIFGFMYELVMVYDALRLRNTIQVIGLCICNVGLLIYGAVQMDQIRTAVMIMYQNGQMVTDVWKDMEPFLIAIPCIIGLGSIMMSFIAYKLYDEFAWTIYKHISADLRMKRRYLAYQIYIALLKFDFFFFLGFTVQFVVIVTNTSDAEFGCTIAAIPVTIIILLLAAFWTRRESTVGMALIILLYHGALAYFIFKLVRMYQPKTAPTYLQGRKSLTFFAIITIILILITIANAIVCTHNFNKGLKPHIASKKLRDSDEKAGMTELSSQTGSAPTRMTID